MIPRDLIDIKDKKVMKEEQTSAGESKQTQMYGEMLLDQLKRMAEWKDFVLPDRKG